MLKKLKDELIIDVLCVAAIVAIKINNFNRQRKEKKDVLQMPRMR